MEISVNEIVSAISILSGVAVSMLYARKAKKAEVRAREIENASGYIENADKMIKLVMEANNKAAEVQDKLLNELKKENEKFKNTTEVLQRAIKSITLCLYRDQCPVYDELQNSPVSSYRNGKSGNGNDPGGSKGHDNPN